MSDQQLSLCPSAEIPAAIEYVDGRATPQKPLVSCLVNVRYLRNVVCVIFAPSRLLRKTFVASAIVIGPELPILFWR
jgi:hypothetical protein